ncbi:MAG: GGDEF domain-containing protein [Acidobacteriota bacterium]|nr:GGDEF domain-containing protein [Acidobacteriota bacterium]
MAQNQDNESGRYLLLFALLDLINLADNPAVRESVESFRDTLGRVDPYSSFQVLKLKMKNLVKIRDTALLTDRCGQFVENEEPFPIAEFLEQALDQLEKASRSTGTFSLELEGALESVRTARALTDLKKLSRSLESSGESMLEAASQFQTNLSDIAHVILDQQRKIDELQGELNNERERSLADELTGVYNRRAFDKQLEACISQARRFHSPLCLFIIDMDNFKEINDNHGHQAGDDVLVNFAGLLKASMRDYDLLFRFGGDEFAVLFPNEGLDKGKIFSDRIKSFIEKKPYRYKDLKFHLSISGGLTELRSEDTREEFFKRADDLLYKAKRTGKARICAG